MVVRTGVHTSGPLASLGYAYGVRPDWSVGFEVSLLAAEASTSVDGWQVESRSASVTAVLLGVTCHPAALAPSPSLRPFIALAVGPHVGSASNNEVGIGVTSESVSETTFGVRAQVGVDAFIGRRLLAGLAVGYRQVGAFAEQIGSSRDFSGAEASLRLGVRFGRGRP